MTVCIGLVLKKKKKKKKKKTTTTKKKKMHFLAARLNVSFTCPLAVIDITVCGMFGFCDHFSCFISLSVANWLWLSLKSIVIL